MRLGFLARLRRQEFRARALGRTRAFLERRNRKLLALREILFAACEGSRALREIALVGNCEDERQVAQPAHLIDKGAALVAYHTGAGLGHGLVPVYAGHGRCAVLVRTPQKAVGSEDHHTVGLFHPVDDGGDAEIGGHYAKEVDAVVQWCGKDDHRANGGLLHVSAQGPGALLCGLVEQRHVVHRNLGLACRHLGAKHSAVGPQTGEAVHPWDLVEEAVQPAAGRGSVGIGHEALKLGQLDVDAHHAVHKGLALGSQLSGLAVVDGGRRAHVFVPQVLGALPDILGRLIAGARCPGGQHGGKQCQRKAPFQRSLHIALLLIVRPAQWAGIPGAFGEGEICGA